jgi:hypothetical protein
MKVDSENTFSWLGSQEKYLDQAMVTKSGLVLVRCYGGNTSAGQYKNEDAALAWSAESWEFSVILDAHNSSASAELALSLFNDHRSEITDVLESQKLWKLNDILVGLFNSDNTRKRFSNVRGETACLIAARAGDYIYWFSIGDCVVYALNRELAKMGQTALNQRQFYNWVGEVNAFDLPTPSFSSGVGQLRRGLNRILLVTDGLLEYPGSQFTDGAYFNEQFSSSNLQSDIVNALSRVHESNGRDSATIIGWDYICNKDGLLPTG